MGALNHLVVVFCRRDGFDVGVVDSDGDVEVDDDEIVVHVIVDVTLRPWT